MGPFNTSYLSNTAIFHFHYVPLWEKGYIYISYYIIYQTKPTNQRLCSPAQPDGMSKLSIYILEGQELIRQPQKIKSTSGGVSRGSRGLNNEPLTQVMTV